MKSKMWILLTVLVALVSCGKDEATDRRSAFLGDWEFDYDLTCTPPGSTISDVEDLEITKGDGSSTIVLDFSGGLTLEAIILSESLFSISSFETGGVTYSGTGDIQSNGEIEILITFSLDVSYCVQTGFASPL